MSIVTFTSDYGSRDYHIALAKARLINYAPTSIVVDIANSVNHFDIIEVSYLMRSCWRTFPMGTVHVLGVKSKLEKMPLIAVKDNQYFITADNGVINLIFDQGVDELYRINLPLQDQDIIFPMGGIFMLAAAHLAKGGTPNMIAAPESEYTKVFFPKPQIEDGGIRCQVIHIDDFGNIVLNFTRDMFESYIGKRSFSILARSTQKSGLKTIINDFSPADLADGIPFAVWGVNDFLHIAMKNTTPQLGGGAARLLGYQKMSNLFIELND
ncbi:MAG: hypothetical protein RLY35_1173 [Bacteroidota bacterium]|jgi:S-adenosylmethionine hydrolase